MRRYIVAICAGILIVVVLWSLEVVRVPAATGTYQSASNLLHDAGLKVTAVDATGRVRGPHDLEVVVSQDPAAGSLRTFGSTVTLRTRVPRDTVVVPDVVGRRVSDAVNVVHDAGLSLATGGFTIGGSTIASTYPAPGAVVPFGTEVIYWDWQTLGR